MRIFYRAIIVISCLIAAIACYVFGIPAGGAVFLILGAVFEGIFWFGLFGRKPIK